MEIRPEMLNTPSLEFSALAREKVKTNQRIVSLGLGEPAFPTPECVIEAAYKAMKDGLTRYSMPAGLNELREAIAERHNRENGLDVTPAQIVVVPGAKQALSLSLMTILKPGDEVVNITPCYVSFIPQIVMAEPSVGLHNVDLRKEDFTLDLDEIQSLMNDRTRAIVINFPHNPTGAVLTREMLDGLVDLVRNRNCYIISDEIYEKLTFSNHAHITPAAHPELIEKTVLINGFSKAFSMTGWRIGYAVLPKALVQPFLKFQMHLNTNIPPFIQKGACAALELPAEFFEAYNLVLRCNADRITTLLQSSSQVSLVPPMGGLFAFMNIAATGKSSDVFATELLAKKSVAVTPGRIFAEAWDDHVRISMAPYSNVFFEGMDLLAEYLNEL